MSGLTSEVGLPAMRAWDGAAETSTVSHSHSHLRGQVYVAVLTQAHPQEPTASYLRLHTQQTERAAAAVDGDIP